MKGRQTKILFKYMLEGIAFTTKIVAPYNFQLCRLLIEYILKGTYLNLKSSINLILKNGKSFSI